MVWKIHFYVCWIENSLYGKEMKAYEMILKNQACVKKLIYTNMAKHELNKIVFC